MSNTTTTTPAAEPKTAAQLAELFHAWVMARGRHEEATRKRKALEALEEATRLDLEDAADALGGPILADVDRGPYRSDKGGYPSRSAFVVFGGTLLQVTDYQCERRSGWACEVKILPLAAQIL